MNIALIAHDAKKKLMQNFCIAYRGILSKKILINKQSASCKDHKQKEYYHKCQKSIFSHSLFPVLSFSLIIILS